MKFTMPPVTKSLPLRFGRAPSAISFSACVNGSLAFGMQPQVVGISSARLAARKNMYLLLSFHCFNGPSLFESEMPIARARQQPGALWIADPPQLLFWAPCQFAWECFTHRTQQKELGTIGAGHRRSHASSFFLQREGVRESACSRKL